MNSQARCYYCERSIGYASNGNAHSLRITRDHIIPRSRGGSHHHLNLLTNCCHTCNGLKGNLFLEQFINLLVDKIEGGARFSDRYITMANNATRLLKDIEPYRAQLFKPGACDIDSGLRFIKTIPQKPTAAKIIETKHSDAPKVKVVQATQPQFESRFKAKYPYIFSLLMDANPDLPRWLYDNVIKTGGFVN